jgi:hypothetical protein
MDLSKLRFALCLRAAAILTGLLAVGLGNPVPIKVTRLPGRHRHRPVLVHQRRDQTSSYTYNWSGYAVTGSAGAVTQTYASWVVPTVNCTVVPGGYSAFWTGIDGWTSSTVEQIGTDSDCWNLAGTKDATPTYYAWYEFYPQYPTLIGNYNSAGQCLSGCVHPGDNMAATVAYLGGGTVVNGQVTGNPQFKVTIYDFSAGWNYSTTSTVPGAQLTSAEWIAETPYGCSTSGGFCALSDFGTAKYGAQYTGLSSAAIVNGSKGPIGSFGANVQEAIMVGYSSPYPIMAQPSALTDNGTSFTVTWKNAGP